MKNGLMLDIVKPKRHPLVSFELPQISVRQHLSITQVHARKFEICLRKLISRKLSASEECCGLQQGDRK